ncbi:MAG: NTP transferase domain-containing protein [Arthrobacter sp.]
MERYRGGDSGNRPAPAFTLVLACDMPRSGAAVHALLDAAARARSDGGLVAVSADGRRQPLVGLYGTAVLRKNAAEAEQRGSLENASVFALIARLELREVSVPGGSTDDVDTWDDAAALGVTAPHVGNARDSHDPGTRPWAPQLNSTLEANGEEPG